jgi:energy-coupling factor transporter ATP-binding protein EcfA2
MKEINPSACYFREFSLENVRCFGPKQTLDFCDANGRRARWTVILGDNGVGKTTLLQCLWLMSPVSIDPEPGAWIATVSRSVQHLQWPGDNARSMVEALSRHGVSFKLSITAEAEPSEKQFSLSDSRTSHHLQGKHIPDFGITMVCIGYGASRKPGGGQVEAQADWDAATLFEEGKFLLDAGEWYLRSDYAAKSDPTGRAAKQHTDVRQILLALLGVQDLRVAGLDQRVARPNVEAHTNAGWVPLRSFSLGYRTSIAWIVDFAMRLYERYPDSEHPLHEPAVCLVDEIDLHLHPRWQRQLIDFLSSQFPRTQFIVSAHSPLVVQAAEGVDAKVVVLRYDEDVGYVMIDDDVQEVRGWRVDQILTSELFGLEGPRSSAVNTLYERRAALVMQGKLDAEQQAELDRIDAELDELPTGDSAEQRHAWDVLQRIATRLEAREDAGE